LTAEDTISVEPRPDGPAGSFDVTISKKADGKIEKFVAMLTEAKAVGVTYQTGPSLFEWKNDPEGKMWRGTYTHNFETKLFATEAERDAFVEARNKTQQDYARTTTRPSRPCPCCSDNEPPEDPSGM
jgi:hypothetical protein